MFESALALSLLIVNWVLSLMLSCSHCVEFFSNFFQLTCIYRPPGRDHDGNTVMSQLCNYITTCCKDNITTVIVGDLNCPKIDWSCDIVCSDAIQSLLYHTVIDLGFHQFVDCPTRGDNII